MSVAVEVDGLVVRYSTTLAVRGLSFALEPGSITVLLGPNGAGKTTTVETIEGYRRPTEGQVRVLGLDPLVDASALAPRMGVMLQRGGVYLSMGPAEILRLFAAYYGKRALDPDALLDRVGLRSVARTPWRRLSGGEQQRLGLALALVGRPEVAFLDEPTAAVDPAARVVVREMIAELRRDGVCVLLTTHDLDDAERLADRVIILEHGTIVADGSPSELMRTSPGHEIRFGAPSGLDVSSLGTWLMATVSQVSPGEYVAAIAPSPANVAQLTAWLAEKDLPLADLRAGRQSLEDVFLRLTSESSDAGPVRPRSRRSRRSRSGKEKR